MKQRSTNISFRFLFTFLFILGLNACGGGGGNGGGGNDTITQMGGSIQGQTLALTGSVSTFAGMPPNEDGIGTAAKFQYPYDVTSDGTNLYVADRSNHSIRQVVIATGEVTTLAGTGSVGYTDGTGTAAAFYNPTGITNDGTNLYVADTYSHTIRQIVIATGVVTTLAGTAGTTGSTDATGAAASFNYPSGITTDGTNLYVVDRNNQTIRQVVIATGVVTTLAGTAGTTGSTDDTGTAALFYYPWGITTDGTNLYVTDGFNQTIRQVVIATGVVTTLAGTVGTSGSADGTGAAALFNSPSGINTDGTNLYVADASNYTIRQIVIATGVVTTLAGSAGTSGSADGVGTAASFSYLTGITTDGSNLYVADASNSTIRQVVIASGVVTTLAGSGSNAGATDGAGMAASFRGPHGITSDGTNLYVADTNNHNVRQIVIATGEVSTLAGSGSASFSDGIGAAASFSYPSGITTDGINLYVVDAGNLIIRQIVTATGEVSTLAGLAETPGFVDGTGTAALFQNPVGITTDGTNLYVTDYNTIRQIVIATGEVTTLAGVPGDGGPFLYPSGIITDGNALYVADTFNNLIRKVSIATGDFTTLAGSGSIGFTDGTGMTASFAKPYEITSDGTYLYVADKDNHAIRQIAIASGEVTTLAGSGNRGFTDGTGTTASFNDPQGITTDGTAIYVADTLNSLIRRIQ